MTRTELPTVPNPHTFVTVLGPYCSMQKRRVQDGYTGLRMWVVEIDGDEVLLSRQTHSDGEVWIYAGRLVPAM